VLFKQILQPILASCAGVIPLIEACVATGIKIGRETGPCGRLRTAARAFVVYKPDRYIVSTILLREKRPI
jgi:hypothetical protein